MRRAASATRKSGTDRANENPVRRLLSRWLPPGPGGAVVPGGDRRGRGFLTHNPAIIGHLLNGLAGRDVMIGSRYTTGGSMKNWGLGRRLLSRSANFTSTPFSAYPSAIPLPASCASAKRRSKVCRSKTPASDGYAFLVELKFLLSPRRKPHGLRCCPCPSLTKQRQGQSKMSADKIWESFWMPWRIRLRPNSNKSA